MKNKTLVVIAGATAVGKTAAAIDVAKYFGTEIISADSRQMYREMNIGTAMPSEEQLRAVKHYFVAHKSVTDYYSAFQYQDDVMNLLPLLWQQHDVVVMTGGSGLYIDAVCKGIDDIPDTPEQIRTEVNEFFKREGLLSLQQEVERIDPQYYQTVDRNNPIRLIRAVEIYRTTGRTFSSLRTGNQRKLPFDVIKIALDLPREQLYSNINQRVVQMIKNGLVDEVKTLVSYRHLNALKTVGYKEIFEYFDNQHTIERAIELIQQNTRHYAKRQLTWFRRDTNTSWFAPTAIQSMIQHIENHTVVRH